MNSQVATAGNRLEVLESRLGLRLASRLSEGVDDLPADISERLRFARERALERARTLSATRAQTAAATLVGSGAVAALAGPPGRWVKLASLVPLAALVAGLALIHHWHRQQQVDAAAEIDAALLADDLPPRAYSDPGFLEFLKTPSERE